MPPSDAAEPAEAPDSPDSLETPIFLLAMPQVMDPFFHKSVILLVRHAEEGSLGFIVNRPTELKIADILDDLEVPWRDGDESCAYFGGPVSWEMGTLVIRDDEESEGLAPGVEVTQSVTDLQRLAHLPADSFRLYLGYAGWDEGQLEQEIVRNDWLIAPVDSRLIFASEPGDVWRSAVESVGIDPDLLPSWTTDAGAN
ncbi:MAG: YqgE/AlgH family protein [Acidobacteriota bacterium]